MKKAFRLLIVFSVLMMSACAQVPDKQGSRTEYFNINAFAKTDIDMVTETHIKQNQEQLRLLAEKLYKRNPAEWKKVNLPTRQAALDRIFYGQFPAVNGKKSIDSIRLAFDPHYKGDRVFAYISGIGSMLHIAFNQQDEFFVFDDLDAQKLYNSARNIEVASWLLRTKKKKNGQPYLLSYSQGNESPNHSYDRIFGKIIGQQDTLAHIIATKTHRAIKNALQSAAKFVFLPV